MGMGEDDDATSFSSNSSTSSLYFLLLILFAPINVSWGLYSLTINQTHIFLLQIKKRRRRKMNGNGKKMMMPHQADPPKEGKEWIQQVQGIWAQQNSKKIVLWQAVPENYWLKWSLELTTVIVLAHLAIIGIFIYLCPCSLWLTMWVTKVEESLKYRLSEPFGWWTSW